MKSSSHAPKSGTVRSGACVTIVGGHTNIVHIETHNGVVFTSSRRV